MPNEAPGEGKVVVACVFWRGDFRGKAYTAYHVEALRGMVSRNLSIPHSFVCLHSPGAECSTWPQHSIEAIPLRHASKWPGWWAKMELFDPETFAPGTRILYLDLDTIVCGPIDWMIIYAASEEIRTLHQWHATAPWPEWARDAVQEYRRAGHGRGRGKKTILGRIQSSAMSWVAGSPAAIHIWKEWMRGPTGHIEHYLGDQDFLSEVGLGSKEGLLDTFYYPRASAMKIPEIPEAGPRPGDPPLVVCSGAVKPEQLAYEKAWARALWRH